MLDLDQNNTGYEPLGDLIYDGTYLYGMAGFGGANNFGTIFKFQPPVVGIHENSFDNSVSIYPNPSFGQFNLVIKNEPSIMNGEVIIYNLLGELVHSEKILNPALTFNLNVPKGIYFLNIKTANQSGIKKLVVQ